MGQEKENQICLRMMPVTWVAVVTELSIMDRFCHPLSPSLAAEHHLHFRKHYL